MTDPKQPYNHLPHLPPKDFDVTDKDILIKSLSARSSLAALNSALHVDKFSIAHALNMMSPLYVPEAVASSGVEEIITTNESIYMERALGQEDATLAEKEVMRYTEALAVGYRHLTKKGFLATNQYVAMQRALEPSRAGIRKVPGTQLANPSTGAIYYTPPDNEKTIRSLLANFEAVFNEDAPDHEALARAAILHYQFEAIHPFHDGNGRTGRILIPLYLTRQKVLFAPLLFASRYILKNRDEYYKLLRDVTFTGAWKQWVLYMLDALDEQSQYTLGVLEKIYRFNDALAERIKKYASEAKAEKIAELIYTNPFFTQQQFEEAVRVSPLTARKYLLELASRGIIVRKKQPRRNRYLYACPEYVKLLRSV